MFSKGGVSIINECLQRGIHFYNYSLKTTFLV
jgi:hypothetical protein